MTRRVRVGCAGWSLPKPLQDRFGPGDSHLQRYATRFGVAEINSSFYRPHAPSLYEKWAAAVPDGFEFSVKLPREITHDQRLADSREALAAFLNQVAGLGDKLGCLLVQLPPSLAFDKAVASAFLEEMRRAHPGDIALEPRHASWFADEADAMLRAVRVSRVLADPVRHEPGRWPGGWPQSIYLRLHGSPRVYFSEYPQSLLKTLAARIARAAEEGCDVRCIFDNTASGAAAANALGLAELLASQCL